MAEVEIRVLGPLELVCEGGLVPLAPLPRRLLAALVTGRGETCSTDRLLEALWEERPPASAAKLLQVYISQLRKLLPAPLRIETGGDGYALHLDGTVLDSARFERLLGEGRAALADGNPALASSLLGRALGLWRGVAYGELGYAQFARADAERLEELRLVASEERLEAKLTLGRHRGSLSELQGLVAEQPLRERPHALAMLALYRCGRQAEALDLYAGLRVRLRDELGLDPGPELRELQRRILRHDPELAAPAVSVAAPFGLPVAPNRLLGRERELAELEALLLRDGVRLLVLTGAGGSGKTRLALELARRLTDCYANGTAFVELAPLRDPGLVVSTIARSLGVERLSGEPLEVLAGELHSRELLLVVDNAEHLRPAAPVFVELLARAPRLALVVTSRAVLHLSGEQVFPVEPLDEAAAVELFGERARAAEPRVQLDERETVAAICERLDRLPLAIELAAGHLRTLTPGELLVRLERRLPLLAGGPHDLPTRQLTLQATIDWSLDLLDPLERRDLARLAVFPGGCTLEATIEVCETTLERLATLVDHSLLRRTGGPEGSRYVLLETIREHALAQLTAAGEVAKIRHHQHAFLLGLAERANLYAEAEGPQDFELIVPEQDNVRAVLGWAIAAGEIEAALRLAVALENFWVSRDPFEGITLFARLLDAAASLPPRLHARALRAFAGSAHLAGEHEQARRLYEQSLNLFRTLADERATAVLTYRLGYLALDHGDLAGARLPLEQSLADFRRLESARGQAQATGALGALAQAEGNLELAAALFEESADRSERIGRTWWQARMLANLAAVKLQLERLDETGRPAREALHLAAPIGDRQTVLQALAVLACAAARSGDPERAGQLWGAIEAEEARGPTGTLQTLRHQYAEPLRTTAGPHFESGHADGLQFTLADALELATAAKDSSRGADAV